jgi:hypothetical protein
MRILSAVLIGLLTACSQLSSPPVAYRQSILGQGLVLIITNASPDVSLIHVGIRATRPGESTREALLEPSLAPGETVEAGWLELRQEGDSSVDQASIVAGTKIEIFARGFGMPLRVTVPERTR